MVQLSSLSCWLVTVVIVVLMVVAAIAVVTLAAQMRCSGDRGHHRLSLARW